MVVPFPSRTEGSRLSLGDGYRETEPSGLDLSLSAPTAQLRTSRSSTRPFPPLLFLSSPACTSPLLLCRFSCILPFRTEVALLVERTW